MRSRPPGHLQCQVPTSAACCTKLAMVPCRPHRKVRGHRVQQGLWAAAPHTILRASACWQRSHTMSSDARVGAGSITATGHAKLLPQRGLLVLQQYMRFHTPPLSCVSHQLSVAKVHQHSLAWPGTGQHHVAERQVTMQHTEFVDLHASTQGSMRP